MPKENGCLLASLGRGKDGGLKPRSGQPVHANNAAYLDQLGGKQCFSKEDGGADRNRTCDLLIANETLYQLSYDPIYLICNDLHEK